MKTHTLDKYLLQNLIDFNNKYHDERSLLQLTALNPATITVMAM